MKKKSIYTLVAVVISIIAYLLNDKSKEETISTGIVNTPISSKTIEGIYLPTSTTGSVVHHDYYTLSYSEKHEQAEWVAYELKKGHLSRNKFKRPYFEVDNQVKTKAAHWRNYKKSGYDKGHLCPAGDRRFSKEAHDETFLTSNISPQIHKFNAGIWNTLEQKVRYWADKYNGLYVVTGGVLKNKNKTIGTEAVTVPDYFYKVLIDTNNGPTKVIAFLMPQQGVNKPLYKYVVSVDEIERLTGIDFFPQLNDKVENELEARSDYKGWSFG